MGELGGEFALTGRDGAERVGSVLRQAMGEGMRGGLDGNQRAAAIWLSANGDVERAHTTGVYLRRGRAAGADPILGVYVDSSVRLADFSARREVYLVRLAAAGLAVSGIEFKLSRTRVAGAAALAPDGHVERRDPNCTLDLPPLTPEEEARVEEETAGLPDSVRQAARHAMGLSLRRDKLGDRGE